MTEPALGELIGRDPPAPHSGAQRLRTALADPNPHTRGRGTFRTLTDAVPAAAQLLAAPDADMSRLIERHAYPQERDRLMRSRRYVAEDLLHAAVRALCTAPAALRLLAGDPGVRLPAAERYAVTATLRRGALIAGIVLDETAQRRLTDAAVAALATALA